MNDPLEHMNIADRMYALVGIDDALFCKVNQILGCDTDKCLDEGFVWQCRDCYYDYYDNSIEVRRSAGLQWMTEHHAEQMLSLGFGIVWETVGEEAVMWTRGKGGKTVSQKCHPRPLEGTDKTRAQLRALRNLVHRQDDLLSRIYNSMWIKESPEKYLREVGAVLRREKEREEGK